ncbi:cysteine desulfurase [Acidocella aminolytica]|jgi:cysteine desulfurase/selenocysteine lyase|uniref:cysteine desulfurase n=1 Tax=Acidocella aminolytica 101 = DSM 11237 TaxID=1120923 RepID=A0A0D6PC27_9PROT|nr:cysteine desulfurase [Acidocella aminolytica]GAN78916.1 cysteine desulfurase SufS [Acidocella aminolytica 101 = DSM 11237]SHE99195.1 cysteine desulfurase [Acidocella aminolytica 101 = DSM 11237]
MSITLPALDVHGFRQDFPILSQKVHGKPFVFLDSGASAQKPKQVIEAMRFVMEEQYANVHRGLHYMSEKASDAYENVRDKVAELLNAASREEIVFTRNATESINLVAYSWGRTVLKPGDAVAVSEMEHHANLVPWQMLRDAHGTELRIIKITDSGELNWNSLEDVFADGKVKLLALTHMSNVLGSYTPVERLAKFAHEHGAKILLDGAQAIVHRAVDVQAIDADFYVFSGHKLYGPTGVGVLYAKAEILGAMPPFMGGGDMIASVSYEKSVWAKPPHRFEAGTPAIIETIGLGAAIDYVRAIGFDAIAAHEQYLTEHALATLSRIEGLRILGSAQDRGGVISFVMKDAHAHDIATLLDRQGIAVRAGHHCAEPLMGRLGVSSTARATFGLYTLPEEIDALATGLERVRKIFA